MPDSTRPLKVLHCIYTLEVGGAETMLVDIINEQLRQGLEVSLLIVNKGVNEDLLARLDKRATVVRMERRQGDRPLLMMLRLNLMVRRLRPDIIHAHHHKFCRLLPTWRRRLIFTVHDMGTPMVYCSRSNMAAITNAVEKDVRQRVPDAKIVTVLNGIRTADILAGDNRHETGTPFRIVQVARLEAEKKGQDILINALGILKEHGITNVEVDFIGSGSDLDMLRDLANSRGVADRVRFLGLRDRQYIYTHLHEYHAMCHPSRYEGFGLIIAEAMAAGLPVVVPRGDGPWEVAGKGRFCLDFALGDAADCADTIERLMANYDDARERARHARDFVAVYDISRTVADYTAVYSKILS